MRLSSGNISSPSSPSMVDILTKIENIFLRSNQNLTFKGILMGINQIKLKSFVNFAKVSQKFLKIFKSFHQGQNIHHWCSKSTSPSVNHDNN